MEWLPRTVGLDTLYPSGQLALPPTGLAPAPPPIALTAFALVRLGNAVSHEHELETEARRTGAFVPLVAAPQLVPPIGEAGAATFAMLIEAGARVTLSWSTDVQKAWSGKEKRRSMLGLPRQRYEFTSLLDDPQSRRILSALAGVAADAPLFLLGLAYEELTIVAATPTTIAVHSLALCDWAVPGQRILVDRNGVIAEAVVQRADGAVITVDQDLRAIATAGARVMPAVGIRLEPEQSFAYHRTALRRWNLVARADRFGFGAASIVGTGATINTFDGLLVWDYGVALDLAERPLVSGVELVDLGGKTGALSSYVEPDWGRAIRIESSRVADWQWFKRFLDAVRGRHRTFLLATGRPDLIPIGDASTGTLVVQGPPLADAPDYARDWFPSLAHRRLRLLTVAGTFAYRKVVAVAPDAGAQALVLDAPLVGALARVELLELVRLDNDEVTVTWHGHVFEAALAARVVQQ